MDNEKKRFDFAPRDLTDARQPLDWKTKYPIGAVLLIICEACYVFILLTGIPIIIFCIWLKIPEKVFLSMPNETYELIAKYIFAWLGGIYGGIIIDLKWLYHSVAKKRWHVDRILWRLCEPHLSGGLGMIFMFLLSSGLISIFDKEFLNLPPAALSIGILVGLFSDNAIAKLAEIAGKIFGTAKKD